MKAQQKPDGTLIIKKKVDIKPGTPLNTPKPDDKLHLESKSREDIEGQWKNILDKDTKPRSQQIPWYPTYAKKEAKKDVA